MTGVFWARCSATVGDGLATRFDAGDKQASIERRRRLVSSGPLPPPLAARFTWGSGVHRTTVQNALREAQGREGRPGIITVQERRRRGQRSLTNIIRIVSRDWLNWLHKGPPRSAMRVGSDGRLRNSRSHLGTSASPPLGGRPD